MPVCAWLPLSSLVGCITTLTAPGATALCPPCRSMFLSAHTLHLQQYDKARPWQLHTAAVKGAVG